MKPSLKQKLKKALDAYRLKKEASMTGTGPVASGGVEFGGDAARTPFAFRRKGVGNVRAATQLGYKLAKKVNRSKDLELENQKYSEPAYASPAFNIEPVDSYKDEEGLVQHNDPEIDPNLVGYKQGQLPMYEVSYKNLYKEGFNGLKYEQEGQLATPPPQQSSRQQVKPSPQPPVRQKQTPDVNVKVYDVLPDFTAFDNKLKSSTEESKNNLQKKIQDTILGKKVVIRASKGYKQPETDYTINVTGVNIDYYYDRYVIIIVGREENKQKVAKFFIKPGFKIKIMGAADNLKPKDRYQVAKSKAMVEPDKQQSALPKNTATADIDSEPQQSQQPQPPQSPQQPQPNKQ